MVNRGQFKKGYMPPTAFKKGNKPVHTAPVGTESVWKQQGYLMRKVAPGQWVAVQRLVWEENFGPVPDGHIVIFKDGDKMNISPANLDCVPRKKQMMINTCNRWNTIEGLRPARMMIEEINRIINLKREKPDRRYREPKAKKK